MLSVGMLTYNHEKYIAQAIDSILMQEVNFDYEIVIADDCSTDNTREIILDYQKRYPDIIKPLFQENLGSQKCQCIANSMFRKVSCDVGRR